MHTVNTFQGITADISQELVEGYAQDISGFVSLARKLERYAELDGQYLRRVLKQRGFGFPTTIRMLESHGITSATKYTYTDVQKGVLVPLSVEEWIAEHEGKYECLYISVCNQQGHRLAARKSVLVYPQGIWCGADLVSLSQKKEANEIHILRPE